MARSWAISAGVCPSARSLSPSYTTRTEGPYGRTTRLKNRSKSLNREPPKPRLRTGRSWIEVGRLVHNRMLELPTNKMGRGGGGILRSRASNFRTSGSKRLIEVHSAHFEGTRSISSGIQANNQNLMQFGTERIRRHGRNCEPRDPRQHARIPWLGPHAAVCRKRPVE